MAARQQRTALLPRSSGCGAGCWHWWSTAVMPLARTEQQLSFHLTQYAPKMECLFTTNRDGFGRDGDCARHMAVRSAVASSVAGRESDVMHSHAQACSCSEGWLASSQVGGPDVGAHPLGCGGVLLQQLLHTEDSSSRGRNRRRLPAQRCLPLNSSLKTSQLLTAANTPRRGCRLPCSCLPPSALAHWRQQQQQQRQGSHRGRR